MLPLPQIRKEVHLQRLGELGGGAEGEVHVLPQHLRDVRLRDLHALRQLALVHAQLLHPAEDAAEERRADMINCLHAGIAIKYK